MKIVTIIGARPQFIKAATVSRMIRHDPHVKEILVHTGQHYDTNMSDIFFEELDIPHPDFNLEVGSGSHASQTARMLEGIEEILMQEKPDWTLVFGDTNSTLAGAVVAAKLNIPLAHVEAGLRSFNRRMPEEINRIVTDSISNLLFAPTPTAVTNLGNEGLSKITIFSGDVMFDSVLFYKEKITGNEEKYRVRDLPGKFLLATVHRAENTDDIENLKRLFLAFAGSGHAVVLPVHPRTRKIITGNITIPGNVILIDPVGYLQMLWLILNCEKVLTDSGGLQKEAYFLGKQCITLRTETEWVETLHDNWNTVTGTDPGKISDAIVLTAPTSPQKLLFGDGNAAAIIVGKLKSGL
ncbi:MAG: UDP-N-acetylglucosamine 2-epimerase (non-hydrolyzing) [Bacteroidetes bacterium]|nr:UDP-N-acetylglucosamine 2-epimerase (non-hydrolyzing) [Bacteroidota bacterium]